MKFTFKDNFIGYLKFYKNIVGNHLFYYLIINVFVGVLDGFGLAMFIPLLTVATGEGAADINSGKSMGNLKFLVDGIHNIGLPLTLNIILLFLVLLFTFKGVLRFWQTKYFAYIRYLFLTRVRNGLVDHLQKISYRGFTTIDSGRIQNNMVGEVGKLFSTMTNYFNSAQTCVLLSTYVLLAFIANWQFAILIGIGAALSNFIFRRVYKATKKASKAISLKGHNFNSFLIQAVIYFKYLKATNYFTKYADKLRKVIKETEDLNVKMGHYQAITVSIREPITILIIACVISLQVNYLNGSLGSIIVSLLFFYRALTYLSSLQVSWQNFIQNVGSMGAVSLIMQEMHQLEERKGSVHYTTSLRRITAENIGLSYGKSTILENIDLAILKNETIAFVGESGAGKTSLANILSGLIEPSEGKVLINGQNLWDYNVDDYRNKIGYISQDPVIFNDNIFNNITFWAEDNAVNRQKFCHALEMASLTSFIQGLPEKEYTVLGDHGMLISGGQKQRISIARELFKEVDLLVLDEATSALDSETEKIIKENIDKLKGKYTMIIIAHRLATIKNADRIYLLANGGIQYTGTFDELQNVSDHFQKMVALQHLQ